MNKETFKDEKGTFHYEPVVWGDWKEGDKVVFEGYLLKTYYDYTLGETYVIGWEGGDIGDEVVFDEVAPNPDDNGGYYYIPGKTYLVGSDGCDFGPLDENNLAPGMDYKEAFKFSRKVYDVVESNSTIGKTDVKAEEKYSLKQEKSLDNLLKELDNLKQEEKEIAGKIATTTEEINSLLVSHGFTVTFTNL